MAKEEIKTAIDFIKEANKGYMFREVIDNLTDDQLVCAIEDYARYYSKNQNIVSNSPIRLLTNQSTQEKQGWVKIEADFKMLPLRSVVGLRSSGEALLTTSLHLTDQTYQFVYYIELPQKPEV